MDGKLTQEGVEQPNYAKVRISGELGVHMLLNLYGGHISVSGSRDNYAVSKIAD